MSRQKQHIAILILVCFISLIATYEFFAPTKKNQIELNTLYGDFTITEPILIDLINSNAVQRMKNLKQFGILHYVEDFGIYNRYIHSIGVFVLLRKYGATLEEQIAGLLHDVSHTAFSHLADDLFADKADLNNSYQDNIHKWFLEQTDIPTIIAKYGYTIDDFLHKSGGFLALEQKLPDLCADRLEYILYENALKKGGTKKTTNKEFTKFVLDNLHFENGIWYFDSPKAARAYSDLTLEIPQTSWMSQWSRYVSNKAAKMVRRAVELNLVDHQMIHFGTDKEVWEKLCECTDPKIQTLMYKICNHEKCYEVCSAKNHDIKLTRKFKGVNPYVKTDNGLQRLSEIDADFAKYYQDTKVKMEKDIYIKEIA